MKKDSELENASKPIFVDTRAEASLPGRVQVQFPVWARCFPAQSLLPLIGLVVLAIFAAYAATHHGVKGIRQAQVLIIPGLYLLFRLAAGYVMIKEHFKHGCANAAKVVAVNPYLVAVAGDLANSGGYYPVVKIIQQPLERIAGPTPKVGDRLATVALYGGSFDKPYWDDFNPIAVNCVTADERQIQRLLSELDEEEGEWDALDKSLAQVPTPYRLGLYRITS